MNALSKGATAEAVAAILAGSPEYFQNRGLGNPQGFLEVLFADGLGRPLDQEGRTGFGSLLAEGVSPATVALMVLSSPEARGRLASGFYAEFLHRQPDMQGLNAHTNLLLSGLGDEVDIALFLASPEYLARLQ